MPDPFRRRPGGPPEFCLQARFVLPIQAPPIEGGCVWVRGGRIAAVSARPDRAAPPPLDAGDAWVLPALVNAHTHLEFSLLDEPLGRPGEPLSQWIRRVVAWRRAQQEAGPERAAEALRRGLEQCAAGGAALVGEIAAAPPAPSPWPAAAPDATLFLERIALQPDQAAERLEEARQWVAQCRAAPRAWRPGLSPHAPYSVRPWLVEQLAKLSGRFRLPLAMHLAESPEELQLLGDGRGPLVELLEQLGAWAPGAIPAGAQPLDYLQLLEPAHRILVIHGNYLTPDAWRWLAQRRARASLVYCPRTHARFAHPPYPLRAAAAAGVRIALGTDSRASNPDLSMLDELRFAAQQHAEARPADLVRMATLDGAAALGQGGERGELAAGRWADLMVVRPAGPADRAAPLEQLLFGPVALQAVFRRGALVFGRV